MRNIFRISPHDHDTHIKLGLGDIKEEDVISTLRKVASLGFNQITIHVNEFHNSGNDETIFFCEEPND